MKKKCKELIFFDIIFQHVRNYTVGNDIGDVDALAHGCGLWCKYMWLSICLMWIYKFTRRANSSFYYMSSFFFRMHGFTLNDIMMKMKEHLSFTRLIIGHEHHRFRGRGFHTQVSTTLRTWKI